MDGKDDAGLLIPATAIEHAKFSSVTVVSIIWEEIKSNIQSPFLRNFWFESNKTTLLLKILACLFNQAFVSIDACCSCTSILLTHLFYIVFC